MKIIFIGTSEFASIILNQLIESNYSPCLILTETDKPAGRKMNPTSCPVKLLAEKHDIEVIQPIKIQDSKPEIEKINPDLVIVISYGQILPQEILNLSKNDCLNVHPSLLPRYRGSSPIQAAVLNQDSEIGVTIIKMTDKIDSGPIVASEKLKIENKKLNYQELHDQLANLGARLLIEIIPKWINEKINFEFQDESKASFTEKINKKDGKIDWNLPAEKIEAQIRAFNPWPGTFSFYKDKKTGETKMMKVLDAEIQEQTNDGPFGSLGKVYIATNNRLAVQTGKNFLIIKKLQMENKNPVDVEDFINGNIDFIGTILE